jgi:hypothetical protein
MSVDSSFPQIFWICFASQLQSSATSSSSWPVVFVVFMVFIQAKSKLQESAMVNRKPDRSPGNHELFRDFAVELSQASAQAILPQTE